MVFDELHSADIGPVLALQIMEIEFSSFLDGVWNDRKPDEMILLCFLC